MRKHAHMLLIALTAVVALLAAVASPAMATKYLELETEAATEVTATSAKLNGTIHTGGYSDLYGFEFGEKSQSGWGPGGEVITTYEPKQVSKLMTELKPETTYYFRIGAVDTTNEPGIIHFGKELTFTTKKLMGLYVNYKTKTFNALTYPATIAGDQLSGNKFTFKIGADRLTCSTAHFTSSLSSSALTLPVHPELSGCSSETGIVTAKMNSCHFDFQASEGMFGTINVSCEKAEDGMDFVYYGGYCTVRIPAGSSSATSASYVNEGNGEGSSLEIQFGRSVSYTKSGQACFLITGSASLSGGLVLKQVG